MVSLQMLVHQQALRKAKAAPLPEIVGRRPVRLPSSAARAQAKGIALLDALERTLSAETLDQSVFDGPPSVDTSISGPSSSNSSPSDEDLLAADLAALQKELDEWKNSGIMTNPKECEDFDLILFWEVGIFLSVFLTVSDLTMHSEQEEGLSNTLSYRLGCHSGSSIGCPLRKSVFIEQGN